jgi:hypothetical protein
VVAEELGTLDIKEGAVEELELRGGVMGAWGEAWNALGVVGCVDMGIKRYIPSTFWLRVRKPSFFRANSARA